MPKLKSSSRIASVRPWWSCHAVMAVTLLAASAFAAGANAQSPITTCDAAGIGSAPLFGDGPPVTILSATPAVTPAPASVPYCLVKVLVPTAINIWVGLPDHWNGRWQSVGGGGYAGSVSAPTDAVNNGYAGAMTDTGHTGGSGTFGCVNNCVGNSASNPGQPDIPLQTDFAYRSEHLMAYLGKQLVKRYYGRPVVASYWNGCSTGGRQGLRMAQDYPFDYDGILAGAPAIHWDRFQAGQIWYQVVQYMDNGGPIGGGVAATLAAKENLATSKAVAACDAIDGVVDGVLTDPRLCTYSAAADPTITRSSCTASDATCLTPTEASAIDKMWQGPVSCAGGTSGACAVPDVATRDLSDDGNKRLWYGEMRGTALNGLGGTTPFPIAVAQPQYWVYFDPTWNFRALNYGNNLQFFRDTVAQVGPLMASENPNLAPFRDKGGKLLMWHGFADQLIVPQGTIEYYDAVTQTLGGGYAQTQDFARLFIAPGVGHCGGGSGPQPQGLFDALVNWVEHRQPPETILASRTVSGVAETRPLCPYPAFARYTGTGDPHNAASFVCQ
jgi:Tannase and feruloyl esterase